MFNIKKTTCERHHFLIFKRNIWKNTHGNNLKELFLSLFIIYRFHDVVFEGEGTDMDNRLLDL